MFELWLQCALVIHVYTEPNLNLMRYHMKDFWWIKFGNPISKEHLYKYDLENEKKLFKVNNMYTRALSEICLRLTIKGSLRWQCASLSKAYLAPWQTSTMKPLAKIVICLKLLTISSRGSITDIWQGPKYTSDSDVSIVNFELISLSYLVPSLFVFSIVFRLF